MSVKLEVIASSKSFQHSEILMVCTVAYEDGIRMNLKEPYAADMRNPMMIKDWAYAEAMLCDHKQHLQPNTCIQLMIDKLQGKTWLRSKMMTETLNTFNILINYT